MDFYQYLSILILTGLFLCCGCLGSSGSDEDSSPPSENQSVKPFRMSVSSVINGSVLPALYSCSGPGQVPAIYWINPPNGSQSMTLIMDDPDAPDGVYTHWIVYNLTPESGGIPPNQIPVSDTAGTGLQGINSMKTKGYVPPCPPPAQEHRYIFTLYALDSLISPGIADRVHIEEAMKGHIIGEARIVTLFHRDA